MPRPAPMPQKGSLHPALQKDGSGGRSHGCSFESGGEQLTLGAQCVCLWALRPSAHFLSDRREASQKEVNEAAWAAGDEPSRPREHAADPQTWAHGYRALAESSLLGFGQTCPAFSGALSACPPNPK